MWPLQRPQGAAKWPMRLWGAQVGSWPVTMCTAFVWQSGAHVQQGAAKVPPFGFAQPKGCVSGKLDVVLAEE